MTRQSHNPANWVDYPPPINRAIQFVDFCCNLLRIAIHILHIAM